MSDQPRRDVWMPLYVGDYLRDTMHLSAEAHGAYLLLIMNAWVRAGSLRNDNGELATVAKLPPDRWAKLRPILEEFFDISEQEWRHKRVDHELRRSRNITKQRRNAGLASAKARQQKPNGASTGDEREGEQKAIPSPSPSQDNNSSAEIDQEALKAKAIIESFDEELIGAFGIERKRNWPHSKDFVFASRWVKAGASAELCRPIFLATQRQRAAASLDMIGSLAYFDKAVERALAEANGPAPPKAQGAAHPVRIEPPKAESRKERDRRWVEEWLKTDLWPISHGPHPLAINHMIHPEIYGEFQDLIEAKRRAPKSRGAA